MTDLVTAANELADAVDAYVEHPSREHFTAMAAAVDRYRGAQLEDAAS